MKKLIEQGLLGIHYTVIKPENAQKLNRVMPGGHNFSGVCNYYYVDKEGEVRWRDNMPEDTGIVWIDIKDVVEGSWAVLRTSDNYREVNAYFNAFKETPHQYKGSYGYMHSEKVFDNKDTPHCSSDLKPGFQLITNAQFNIIATLTPKLTEMKSQRTTRIKLIAAYERFSCGDWKEKISRLLVVHALKTDTAEIIIPEAYLEQLNKEAGPEMKEYVRSMGINLEKTVTLRDTTMEAVTSGTRWRLPGYFNDEEISDYNLERDAGRWYLTPKFK